MKIDFEKIRPAFSDARDFRPELPDGLVIVWENGNQFEGEGTMYMTSNRVAGLVEMVREQVPNAEIAYMSTGFNRNAYSVHVRFAPAAPTEVAPAPAGCEVYSETCKTRDGPVARSVVKCETCGRRACEDCVTRPEGGPASPAFCDDCAPAGCNGTGETLDGGEGREGV